MPTIAGNCFPACSQAVAVFMSGGCSRTPGKTCRLGVGFYKNSFTGGLNMDSDCATEDIIKESKNIVFFGGAGVSNESGIRTSAAGRAIQQKYDYPRRPC
jgi:hypothetical protein